MAADQKKILLELRNVTYRYPDETPAVENLSLVIGGGEKIAVLGGNGAGKTTLFLLLNGVYKIKKGEIFFRDIKINYTKKDLLKIRQNIGIVFQDPDTQIFSSSVYEEISFGPENLKIPENEIKIRVDRVLKLLDIFHIKDKPTHLLSYGEKKKVSIAGILVMEPEALILDEPDACLDPGSVKKLAALLDDLHGQGKTILISTQDMNLAYAWADRIIIMKDGKILKDGIPGDIFSDTKILHQASLDKPLVFEILEELKIQPEFKSRSGVQKKELIDFLKKQTGL